MSRSASACNHYTEPSALQGFGIFKHKIRRAVSADDLCLILNPKIRQKLLCSMHDLIVARRAHNDAYFHIFIDFFAITKLANPLEIPANHRQHIPKSAVSANPRHPLGLEALHFIGNTRPPSKPF
jgi:hypothetical protein